MSACFWVGGYLVRNSNMQQATPWLAANRTISQMEHARADRNPCLNNMNELRRINLSVRGGMPVRRRVVTVRVTKPGGEEEFSKSQQEEATEADDNDDLSESYTNVMQERMGAPLVYRHEDGMNYTRILDDLIVGSCLQTEDDVDTLVGEGVSTVMCLQENSDMEYFSLDIDPVRARCSSLGTIDHVRHAFRDFDPYSLRRRLPGAVALCAQNAQKQSHGTIYVHCTAGLGRAPATALAYMWWFKGIPLDEAYDHLTSLRPCKPRVESIREAALDLLFNSEPIDVKISLKRRDIATDLRVAGLDVGWGQTVPLATNNPSRSGMSPRAWLKRKLPPGKFQFKFIWVR